MSIIIINKQDFKSYDDFYYVSRNGEVYSNYSKKILKANLDNDGYPRVDIHGKHMKVHRLVWLVWKGAIPDGKQINHKDDNKLNNYVDNLYLGDQSQNRYDCVRNNTNVGHTYYLTIFDKKLNKTLTFCPAKNFIEYSGHPCQNGNVKRMFSKNWFKQRYEIIEYKQIINIIEKKSVTTMGDECSPVE